MSLLITRFKIALAVLAIAAVPVPAGVDGGSAPLSSDGLDAAAEEHAGLVVVKFTDESRVRLRADGLVSLGGADLAPLSTPTSAPPRDGRAGSSPTSAATTSFGSIPRGRPRSWPR